MDIIESLRKAIEAKKPIQFEVSSKDAASGIRVGNPHIVFVFKSKDGIESTHCHIYQTNGCTNHPANLPGWRQFKIDTITSIEVIDDNKASFEVAEGYNPNSSMYHRIIAGV